MENRSLPVVWLLLLLAIQWQSHDALVETVDQSEGVILTCRPPQSPAGYYFHQAGYCMHEWKLMHTISLHDVAGRAM